MWYWLRDSRDSIFRRRVEGISAIATAQRQTDRACDYCKGTRDGRVRDAAQIRMLQREVSRTPTNPAEALHVAAPGKPAA